MVHPLLLLAALSFAQPEMLADDVKKAEEENFENEVESALTEAARTHARLRRLIADGAEELRRAPLKDEEHEDALLTAELLERKAALYSVRAASVSAKLVELDWKKAPGLRAKQNRTGDLARADGALAQARSRWGKKPAAADETALLGELDSCVSELRQGTTLVPGLKTKLDAMTGERDLLARQLELARYIPQ